MEKGGSRRGFGRGGRSIAPRRPQEVNCDKNFISVNTFAFDLYQLLSKDSQKNAFFSPFSILTALNMTLLGANNNTAKELFDGLRYSLGFSSADEVHAFFKKTLDVWKNTENELALDIANRILVHKTDDYAVNTEYSQQLKTIYGAQVDEVNFVTESDATVKSCNDWVNKATKGKIPSILEKLDKNTRAILLNAIYFKGSWKEPFNARETQMQPFFNFGCKDKAKDVPLMFRRDVKAILSSTNIDGEEVRMLELPYRGDIVMNILLPNSLDGLKKIGENLKFDVIERMNIITREIDYLWLPKFKMETTYQLADTLKMMGVNEAFSNNADFTGIRKQRDVNISEVIHKAAVEVNEEGTVAAAATLVGMAQCGPTKPQTVFRVDHPFAYFIKDTKTGLILFAGSVHEL